MNAPSSSIQQEIEVADDARIRALVAADIDALDRLHGDDLVYVHSSGHAEGKASYLQGLRAGRVRFSAIRREPARVRAWGEVALMDGKVQIDYEMGGKAATAHSRIVSAWVRRDGRWQMVHYHSTTLAQK